MVDVVGVVEVEEGAGEVDEGSSGFWLLLSRVFLSYYFLHPVSIVRSVQTCESTREIFDAGK